MPRRSRKQLVGKKEENYEIYTRTKELADLERSLHRTWRWCGNTIIPIWNTTSSYIDKSSGRTNFKEAG
jgi:hypothetical protein